MKRNAKKYASELIMSFMPYTRDMTMYTNGAESRQREALKNAKSCALVCVDEQVQLIESTLNGWCDWDIMTYFENVVDEIEKFELFTQ
jgi:hypothetical protein